MTLKSHPCISGTRISKLELETSLTNGLGSDGIFKLAITDLVGLGEGEGEIVVGVDAEAASR